MARKKANIRVVEDSEMEDVPTECPVEAPVWDCPDLAGIDIDGAIQSRSLSRVGEVLTDVERTLEELELELQTQKSELGKRIKTVKARRADLIHEVETLTHEWVIDHGNGVAYLVANAKVAEMERALSIQDHATIILLAKRTRPLSQDDLQESLPLAIEG